MPTSYIETKVKESRNIGEGSVRFIATREEFETFLRSALTDLLSKAKECVPEKDTTPDANELETADRMAWNSCREQTLINLSKLQDNN